MKLHNFVNPNQIRLRARYEGEENIVITAGEVWKWKDAGIPFTIDWMDLDFNCHLVPVLKSFIVHRFESKSPRTVGSSDLRMMKALSNSLLSKSFPWDVSDVISFLTSINDAPYCYSFRSFYEWCVHKQLDGFQQTILTALTEVKPLQQTPYQKAYLQEEIISPSDQQVLIDAIERPVNNEDYCAVRDNALLHLGFELAPRPTQLFSLNENDIELYTSDNNDKINYFTIWIPMAKKISSEALGDKRPRRISEKLGPKISRLIAFNRRLFSAGSNALFRDNNGKRLSAPEISSIVCTQLQAAGFNKGDGLRFLRHNLAQALADQGSSADVIAEILGHNSLIPARAYIASTPEIATIKTRALGKNDTYNILMKSFLTGEIVPRNQFPKERWAKGIVGDRYISGVGACGLSKSTPCPFDPIYSCYTCSKFHPFEDGLHGEVKQALQQQAQYFVDTANNAMDLENNRAVLQLEKTVQAVDLVIGRCKK